MIQGELQAGLKTHLAHLRDRNVLPRNILSPVVQMQSQMYVE